MEDKNSPGKTWMDIFRNYEHNITEQEADYVLWNDTSYPFAPSEYIIEQIKDYFNNKYAVMSKTLEELNNEYKYDTEHLRRGELIHPTHKKWLPAAWLIHNIYGFVHNETISLAKARELTTAVIDKFVKEQESEEVKELKEKIKTLETALNQAIDPDNYNQWK